MWPFILGDAWHNNHHFNSKNYSSKISKWEFDPVATLIDILKIKET
jgi:fatty-acid desaturase